MREYAAPKPWELPKWTGGRGRELGLQIDNETAKQLVALVGAGQQRLSRELEKLALAIHPRTEVTLADVDTMAARDAAPQVYDLADALVAGDLRASLALAEANPFTLSGGQKRRLSVATAVAAAPPGLVLDEPTVGQDARTWAELVDLLTEVKDGGTAMLVVSHDLDFVRRLADRTVRMTGGHLAEMQQAAR